MTPFQHHSKAPNMIFYDPKHYPIIELDLKKFMNKVFESIHNYLGKDSRRIIEVKGNYHILETPPLCHKGCLVSIFLHNYDLMVAKEPISKRVNFLTPNTF